MRKLILQMSVSVDRFVGGQDGEMNWAYRNHDPDLQRWIVDSLYQAGVHIMGSNTYHDMAAHWPTSEHAFAAPMNEIPKVVFSKTLQTAGWTESRVARGDFLDEVTRLKLESGKEILAHGGARFAQSLSQHQVVDEYRLVTHPVLLAKGLPLFKDLRKAMNLRLLDTQVFETGAVLQVYRPE
jgi:dihydrofolate reductase